MTITAAQIISEKGGAAIVAAALGKKPGAVRVWKHRNSIPRDAWPDLMQAFPDLTLARLIDAEQAEAALAASDPIRLDAPPSAPISSEEAA